MPRPGARRSLLARFSGEIAELTGQVLRATVAVSGSTSDGGSSGSGFFLDTRGHIVTNHHVISDVQPPITITLHGGAKALAGIVGVDRIADIAVLTLDGKWPHALAMRRSRVRTGEMCLAVGNPLARYPESVTIGVVSGLARTATAGPGWPHSDLLQTDCDIHEGNSGGPPHNVHARYNPYTLESVTLAYLTDALDVYRQFGKDNPGVKEMVGKLETGSEAVMSTLAKTKCTLYDFMDYDDRVRWVSLQETFDDTGGGSNAIEIERRLTTYRS